MQPSPGLQTTYNMCIGHDTRDTFQHILSYICIMSQRYEDTEQILKAIRDGNDRTAVQLQDLKTDMQVIKSDMVSMKGDIGTIKFKVQNVESKQSRIDNDLKKIESKIDMLDHRTETLESDMSALSMNDESRENIIYELTKQVNILEKENKKCNLRIFGLAWIQMRTMIC